MSDLQRRAAICEIGRRLWQRGLLGGCEGNISVRRDARTFLCTPSGQSKGHLKPDDIVVVDAEGTPLNGGQASSEIRVHMECYRQRPDCEAVVHAHPPIATAFGLAGLDIPDNLLPEAAVVLGSVAMVPFGMPGTEELPASMRPFLPDHKTFVLANHGAVTLGKDLYDAYHRMETLERVATVIMHAHTLGTPRPLPDAAFQYLLQNALNGRLD
jgi:L-fuculose-phosphate aldolase